MSKICDGCAMEFDDGIDLYPRLITAKEVQVARKLAEKEGDDKLCISCWLACVEDLDSKQLAGLLLSMMVKNKQLESEIIQRALTLPNVHPIHQGVIEKRGPWDNRSYICDNPESPYTVTWQDNAVGGRAPTVTCGGTHVTGYWANALAGACE